MLLIKHGGVREDACIEEINLAYQLEDGMKIYIPTKQEKENKANTSDIKENAKEYITTSSGIFQQQEESENTKNHQNAKVNINTATQTQLENLPGIGPSTATKIITHRKEKGKFTKIEDIKEVSGIGDAKFNKIKDHITVK